MSLKSKLSLITIFISIGLMSFNVPKGLLKKAHKEIRTNFNIDDFLLEQIKISEEINAQLQTRINENDLFKITTAEGLKGYAYFGKAFGKADDFDFLVLFDTDLIIVKTKVLIYREDYGGEIGSKRWLKQFKGKSKNDQIQYEKDIIAISGATISANAMTVAVNNLLRTINILHQNKAF